MINAIGFLVAVAAVSAVIFVLTTRAENKGLSRARSRGSSSYDGGSLSDSFASWVGYSSLEASSNATDGSSCTTGSWDSGSSDSGGGGDCGGGGGSGSSD